MFKYSVTKVGPKLASEIPTVECDVNPVDSQKRVNSTFELKEVTISGVFKKLQEVNVAKRLVMITSQIRC